MLGKINNKISIINKAYERLAKVKEDVTKKLNLIYGLIAE